MILSEEERAARKRAQVARIGAKGTPEYPALYAKQPEQIRIAAKALSVREAEREAQEALKRATIAAGDDAVALWGSVNDMTTVGAG